MKREERLTALPDRLRDVVLEMRKGYFLYLKSDVLGDTSDTWVLRRATRKRLAPSSKRVLAATVMALFRRKIVALDGRYQAGLRLRLVSEWHRPQC